jgi:hypothetical protein
VKILIRLFLLEIVCVWCALYTDITIFTPLSVLVTIVMLLVLVAGLRRNR